MEESSRSDGGPVVEAPRERLAVDAAIGHFFGWAEEEQYDLHRRSSARAARLADAIDFARAHPEIYALAGDADPCATAERCAILEASARLLLSEQQVRSLAGAATEARVALPLLWRTALEGFASMAQVEAAVVLLPRFEVLGREGLAAVAHFDATLAGLASATSMASFRARATQLARRLAPEPEAVQHARAYAGRHVAVDLLDDGMACVRLHTAAHEAVGLMRRLTSTAKHLKKTLRDGRTRDQLRADLASAWLRGIGTPTAVKTKVFVTVPLDVLAPEARASVRASAAPRHGLDVAGEPQLVGDGPLDAVTARRLLLEAGRFTRVVTDPVTGVVLDMDRRSRLVTRAQREWLLLTHATCTRDGCRRSAAGSDVDHWSEFHGPDRGATDIGNLHPFCGPDHRLKGTTRLRHRRRGDGSVQVRFPSGFSTRPDPPPDLDLGRGVRPVLDRLLAAGLPPGDDPPF